MRADRPQLPDRPRGWTDHLVAAFLTVHLGLVILHLLPNPPRMDDRALAQKDVAQEIDRIVSTLHGATGYGGTEEELEDVLIEQVRRWDRLHARISKVSRLYLRPIGSTQSWNMFGGTPPRHPRVLVIEVRPEGEPGFHTWLDGRWGGSGEAAFEVRHRKIQNRLSMRGSPKARKNYAAWWARRWEQEHPGQRLRALRLVYLELSTPPARRLRAGHPRKEPRRVLEYTWTP